MSTKDELQRLFIDPIIDLKPDGTGPKEFLDIVFSLNTRIVSVYYTLNGYVPGEYLVSGLWERPLPADSHLRKTTMHERIVARTDDKLQNVVEVDVRGHVFRLTRNEWDKYRLRLKKRRNEEEI